MCDRHRAYRGLVSSGYTRSCGIKIQVEAVTCLLSRRRAVHGAVPDFGVYGRPYRFRRLVKHRINPVYPRQRRLCRFGIWMRGVEISETRSCRLVRSNVQHVVPGEIVDGNAGERAILMRHRVEVSLDRDGSVKSPDSVVSDGPIIHFVGAFNGKSGPS
jgi:hypothetical protein